MFAQQKLQFEKSNPFTSKAALDVLAAVTVSEKTLSCSSREMIKAKYYCERKFKTSV